MTPNSDSALENDRWLRVQAGDSQTEDDLIRQYQGLVTQIAMRLKGRLPAHIRLDDLKAAGQVGLWQAIQSFSPDRRIPFERYAPTRIRGAMLDEVRKTGFQLSGEANRHAQARAAYSAQQSPSVVPLDDVEHFDWIVDDRAVSPEESAVQSDEITVLNRAILRLPQQEQLVLSLVFVEGLNLAETADVLSLSRSRVSAIYNGAIKSLKGSMLRTQRKK